MANIKSAKKRIGVIERKTLENRKVKSGLKAVNYVLGFNNITGNIVPSSIVVGSVSVDDFKFTDPQAFYT